MRISSRLTLLITLTTLVVAFGVGWFALEMSSRSQYAQLDGEINAVVESGSHHPTQALSNALYVMQHNGYDLSLDVVFASGRVAMINQSTTPLVHKPSLAVARSAQNAVTVLSGASGFIGRSINIGAGSYLVVAGSTKGITRENEHLALEVLVVALALALASSIIARLILRGDLTSMSTLIRYAGTVSRGGEGKSVPAVSGSRDVRELQTALDVMVQALGARIEAETAIARTMQEFIDDASHELRTPLTVVKGYTELLRSDAMAPQDRARALERMTREISRMESLVSDLLLLAEVREVPEHRREPIDLASVIGTRARDFQMDHRERTVEIHLTEGLIVMGRADFVDRLVANALQNVVRYTPVNAKVRLSLNERDATALLCIDDAGPGLPMYGVAPRRFWRFDESRSRETGGSGLGMSIMADIANGLGGEMTTAPSDLGGASVRFVFPLRR